MTVQAMKGGAIEFLTKPFRDQDLLDAIQLRLSRDRVRRENEKTLTTLRERFASLSPREREIMVQVVHGRIQTNCGRYRHCGSHREGASQPSEAEDEDPFAS
jgi:FixJ family two-component response regulator